MSARIFIFLLIVLWLLLLVARTAVASSICPTSNPKLALLSALPVGIALMPASQILEVPDELLIVHCAKKSAIAEGLEDFVPVMHENRPLKCQCKHL